MALVLDGLVKRFGRITALDGMSFQVERGSVFGFLGANGAGKTTTMRIVLDILKPDAGTVMWDGEPADLAPRETWGYLPEERCSPPSAAGPTGRPPAQPGTHSQIVIPGN
jgi:ABC-2 type transport system ATP-binding protein